MDPNGSASVKTTGTPFIRLDFGEATANAGDGGSGGRGGDIGAHNHINNVGRDLNIHLVPAPKPKDLLYQKSSPAALPDSSERIVQPRCMEETRVELREELDTWEKKPIDAATMTWVLAGAGEGKTALLLTFADLCRAQKRTVGAFFASNRITDCADGNRIVPTLAIQLMQTLPSTAGYIKKALRRDPHLLSKGREVQMNALIVEPIRQIAMIARIIDIATFGYKTYPTLIVIDGLDEVTGKDVQVDLINIIGSTMKNVRLPLRFLVASRPEPHIVDAINTLRSQFPKDRVSIMDLRKDALVHRDIRRYFMAKFKKIRDKDAYLPEDWPGEEVIDQLVDKASGQFIYATTIMPYIMSEYSSPEERLEVIRGLLEKPPGDEPYQNLDELYSLIVRNSNRLVDMLRIMALIIIINQLIATANAPAGAFTQLCSPRQLGHTLDLKRGDVRRCLRDMHSVVNIGDEDRDIQVYHKSFPDFLLDPSRSKGFAVDVEDSHRRLISHLINTSRQRDTILQILGQCLISEDMGSDVDIIGTPANTSSPKRIETILGLKAGAIPGLLGGVRILLEAGDRDQDIKIRNPLLRSLLLDRSSLEFVDLDDARLTLKFAAPIRKVFGAQVFSSAFPGPQMPWNENPSLKLQDMYDQVYSHLIGTSQHRETILRLFGQCLVSEGMDSDVDILETPANTSSPSRIEKILGLAEGTILPNGVIQPRGTKLPDGTTLADDAILPDGTRLADGAIPRFLKAVNMLPEVGSRDQDIKIHEPILRSFLLDRSRSQGLFVDLDDARLTLKFAAPIRKVFGAQVFSSAFPGPRMPWNENPSLQLQDMYDQVYSHLIGTSKLRETIVQILGQVIVAKSMSSDVDIFGTPANSLSPKRLTKIFGLEDGDLGRVIEEIPWMLELRDKVVRIQDPSFLEFLLDRSRSRELFVDPEEARMALRQASIKWIFNNKVFSTVFALGKPSENSVSELLGAALAQCNAAGLAAFLPEMLPNIIFDKYESLVRSAPCDRHPITVILKQICATLHDDGFPSFGDSDFSTKLQMFCFTWEIDSYRSTPINLNILLHASPDVIQKFFSALSNHKVFLPVNLHPRTSILLSTLGKDVIRFALWDGPSVEDDSFIAFSFKDSQDKNRWYQAVPYAYGAGEEGEVQAWRMLADVWRIHSSKRK